MDKVSSRFTLFLKKKKEKRLKVFFMMCIFFFGEGLPNFPPAQ